MFRERNKKENENEEADWGNLKKAGSKLGSEQTDAEKFKLKHVEKDKETSQPTTYSVMETVRFEF